MNAHQRVLLVVQPHLLGIGGQQVIPKHLGLLLAVRAFEIAELHQDDGGAGRSHAGLEGSVQFVEVLLEGIEGDVPDRALQNLAAVAGDVEEEILRAVAERCVHGLLDESGHGSGPGIGDGHGDARVHHQQVAGPGFQYGFIQRRFFV